MTRPESVSPKWSGDSREEERGKAHLLSGLTTAILVTVCCAGAHAQSPSRVDVQLGAALLNTVPAFVIGGTGWIGGGAGGAARIYFMPGHGLDFKNPRAFEAGVRYRRFAQDVEVDFGMSLMALKAEESITPLPPGIPRGRRLGWHQYLTIDVLLGRGLGERFGLKVGTGLAVPAGRGGGEDSAVGFVTRFLAVVPLGGL